jgi:hypothetical protein
MTVTITADSEPPLALVSKPMLARETARMAAVFESGLEMQNCWELHRATTSPTKQTPTSKLGIPTETYLSRLPLKMTSP